LKVPLFFWKTCFPYHSTQVKSKLGELSAYQDRISQAFLVSSRRGSEITGSRHTHVITFTMLWLVPLEQDPPCSLPWRFANRRTESLECHIRSRLSNSSHSQALWVPLLKSVGFHFQVIFDRCI
jgi:hypothetical protein